MDDSSKPPWKVGQAEIDLIRKVLSRLGVRGGDLDDTTGEVLLDLSVRLPESDPTKPLGPWCQGFARLGARAYRRRKRRLVRRELLVPDPDDLHLPENGPSPQEHAMSREDLAELDALLDELAPAEAAVLLLYEGTALEMDDVAGALGIPEGTAASRLHRARRNLRAARARLQARKGELRGVVPPLWILFDGSPASFEDGAEPGIGAGTPAAASPLGAAAPWMAAGLLGALAATSAIAVGAVVLSRCNPPDPSPSPIAQVAAVSESALSAPSAMSPTPPGAAPPPLVSAAPAPSASEAPRDELTTEEIKAQVRAARTSLAGGDATGALNVLIRLDRRERRGLLFGERETLRIEILARLSRLTEARLRLARLRTSAPEDPRLKRLERILSASP